MMQLSHASDGFVFIAFVTGFISFFGLFPTYYAIIDGEDHSGLFLAIEIITILIFLTSGFIGLATQ